MTPFQWLPSHKVEAQSQLLWHPEFPQVSGGIRKGLLFQKN